MRRINLVLLQAVFCLSVVAGISGCAEKNDNNVSGKNSVSVEVAAVKKGSIEKTVSLTGDVHGDKEVKVYAKVPGKLVQKVKNEGDRVKKDDIIALIDRDEAGLEFSKAEVKAPIDGMVTMYFPDLGDAVFPAPGQPVAEVADMDKIKIVVYLSEADIGRVKEGQSARVLVGAYPDRIFHGKVNNVAPAANPATRKLKAEITVSNPGYLLKPGTFARVEIVTEIHENILLVPRLAVLERDGEKIVFVEKNGKAEAIKVEAGAEDGENVEIKSGLKEGREVIVRGNYALLEGARVEVTR